MPTTTNHIMIEVAYALPHQQAIIPLSVPANTTAQEAIMRSGILNRFPDIDLTQNAIGIFGKAVSLDTTLRTGDRVEIYRPLIADPKEIRRQRALAGKAMKKGG